MVQVMASPRTPRPATPERLGWQERELKQQQPYRAKRQGFSETGTLIVQEIPSLTVCALHVHLARASAGCPKLQKLSPDDPRRETTSGQNPPSQAARNKAMAPWFTLFDTKIYQGGLTLSADVSIVCSLSWVRTMQCKIGGWWKLRPGVSIFVYARESWKHGNMETLSAPMQLITPQTLTKVILVSLHFRKSHVFQIRLLVDSTNPSIAVKKGAKEE